MQIDLTFSDPVSEAYRQKLQTFLDKILAQGLTENRAPDFYFSGMNWKTFTGIAKLQSAYDDRHGA